MSYRKMWGIVSATMLMIFVGLLLASFTTFNVNIYANHRILGQLDPGIMRLIIAVGMAIFANRVWHITINHSFHRGWQYFWRTGWLIILIAVANATVSSDRIVWDSLFHSMNATNIALLFSVALCEAVFVGMFEEVMIRGIVMGAMLNTFRRHPVCKSIIFSSIAFGLLHALNYAEAPFWDTTNQIIYATGMGILLATTYYLSRNLWVSIALHSLMDYTAFVFALHSIYTNQATSNSIDWSSIFILLLTMVISYVSLIRYQRRRGNQSWWF